MTARRVKIQKYNCPPFLLCTPEYIKGAVCLKVKGYVSRFWMIFMKKIHGSRFIWTPKTQFGEYTFSALIT